MHPIRVSAESPLRPLLRIVMDQYRLHLGGIHGITHWARVLENGRRLSGAADASGMDGAVVDHDKLVMEHDKLVMELFAIFHDACRHGDGIDPGHGPRAAELVSGLWARIPLDDRSFAHLVEACECHTRGPRPGAHPTVRACLDADRLDIPRVGLRVRPELLCTSAGRAAEMIAWASARAASRYVPGLCTREWGWEG